MLEELQGTSETEASVHDGNNAVVTQTPSLQHRHLDHMLAMSLVSHQTLISPLSTRVARGRNELLFATSDCSSVPEQILSASGSFKVAQNEQQRKSTSISAGHHDAATCSVLCEQMPESATGSKKSKQLCAGEATTLECRTKRLVSAILASMPALNATGLPHFSLISQPPSSERILYS